MTAVLIQNRSRNAGAWVHMRRPGSLRVEGMLEGDELVIAMRGEERKRMSPLLIKEDGVYPVRKAVAAVQAYRSEIAGGGSVSVSIDYGTS